METADVQLKCSSCGMHKKFSLSAEQAQQIAAGVTDDYVRISVGTEHIDDIIADVDQALKASSKV